MTAARAFGEADVFRFFGFSDGYGQGTAAVERYRQGMQILRNGANQMR